MKKLLSLLMLLAFLTSAGIAQVPAKTTTTTKTATSSNAIHTKKDGTADKRYKENKAAKTVTRPTKKDGTADMRYKANKTVKP